MIYLIIWLIIMAFFIGACILGFVTLLMSEEGRVKSYALAMLASSSLAVSRVGELGAFL